MHRKSIDSKITRPGGDPDRSRSPKERRRADEDYLKDLEDVRQKFRRNYH